MRAMAVKTGTNGNKLILIEKERPRLEEQELLIKVEAAGINRTDLLSREKVKNDEEKKVLGIEVSGTVAEVKGESNGFSVGDRVMGLVNEGGYAEYAVLPAERAMRIPDGLSFMEAAAIPEVFLTAYQTLFWHGKLAEKETVLIHAGGSGVGTAAIQLAKKFADAQVIVTAGSQEKLDFCKQLGADVLINYKEQDFAEEVLKATDGAGVDAVLDFVGASYWEKNLRSLKPEGRWVLIGVLGGSVLKEVDLMALMAKYIQITGTLLTPRSDAYKARLTKEFAEKALPLFKNRELKPMISTTFPLGEAQDAQAYMEASRNIGKIILETGK